MTLEVQAISAICKNKDVSVAFTGNVDDFFLAYGDVWEGLKSYYAKYRVVPDADVLASKFKDFEPVDTNEPAQAYIDKLRGAYLESKIKSIVSANSVTLSPSSAARILEQLQAELSTLNKYNASVKDIDITDIMDAEKHYSDVKLRAAAMGGSVGIPTGFAVIDKNYHTHMAGGHLIVMIGWPGRMKSWMSERIAVNAWRAGFKPMIVSLEMSGEGMRDRLYTLMGEGQFEMSSFSRGDIDVDDFRTWGKKTVDGKANMIIVSPEGLSDVTPNVIQGKIDKYRPDIVICDYHQLMMDNRKTVATTERNMNLSRELKLLAVKNNIPVIDITAATMSEVSDQNDPPLLSQVAWSKAIEYDADMAMAVHRQSGLEGPAIVEVVSRKNRHGSDFAMYLSWDVNRGVIEEKFTI